MADKNAVKIPNPFSVLVSIAHYIGRYATHARKAAEDSWKNGRDMQPHFERGIRWFSIPSTEQWPKYVAGGVAVFLAFLMFILRLILALLRALAK